jgi:competence protein ComEA
MKRLRQYLSILLLLIPVLTFAAQPVDINQADAVTIAESMDGIGPKKAAAIIAYREANGPFKNVDELLNVKGVGRATLAKNRDRLMVGQAKPAK